MGWQQSQDSRQRTRVNTNNGYLFLAQSTDSQRRSTSLMRTLYYELCAVIDLSFLKEKDLQLTVCRCSQRYSTPNRMIFRRQFQTSLASKELWSERTVFIKLGLDERFLSPSWMWSAK